MDLFDHAHQKRMKTEAPLAARMRPRTLDEFVGQEAIVAPESCCAGRSRPTGCFRPSSCGGRRERAKPPWRW